jgi:tetratricopeptide (TPR) repeat protein
VALYEALAGKVAFDAKDLDELILLKSKGAPPLPEGVKLAPRLRRILQRGMSADPADRYPDMQALIAELSVDPRKLKARRFAIFGAAMVLVVGSLAGAKLYQDFRNQCAPQPEAWADIWDDEAKAKLRASFAANPKAPPDSVVEATLARFDDYRSRWDEVEARACAETRFAGRVPEAELESRRFCLHRQRRTIGGYAQAPFDDPALTDSLLRRAQQLPTPEDCVVREEEAPLPLAGDPEARRQALELAAANATVAILSISGEHETARAKARENLDAARGNHDALAEAQALSALLRIAVVRSEYAQCEALALAGFDAADRAEAPELWLRIADMWLSCLSRSDEVAAAEAVYAFALQRAKTQGTGGLPLAGFQRSWGQALIDAGRIAEGRERLEDALKAARAELGDEHVSLGAYYNSLGNAYIANPPELDLATQYYERAIELWARDYGPMHENVGHATNNLAIIQIHRGQFEAARTGLQRAIEIYARTFGDESASMAFPLSNLGEVELYPDSLAITNPLLNKADALAELGRGDEAVATMKRVIELLRQHGRDGDVHVVQSALVRLLLATGHPEQARALLREIRWGQGEPGLPQAQTDALFALEERDATALLEASRRVAKLAESGSYQALEARIFALEARALGAESNVDPAALVRDIEALLSEGHPLVGRVWIAEAVALRDRNPEAAEKLARRALERLGLSVSVQQARWFREFGLSGP